MSILNDINDYLAKKPDKDIFELFYILGKFDQLVEDFWIDDPYLNIDEEMEIIKETIDDSMNTDWFKEKDGRYDAFLQYIREHMISYYEKLKGETK